MPKGVLNILTGDSSAIGKVLCEHPAVRFVGFTGSTEVGKMLNQQAAVGVKKLGLELGGNAPFIVFDDADIDAAVEGAMVSKYRNMGQTCVCANRIYAQDGIYDQFVEKLSKKVAAMKVGDGTEAGVVQGPLINMEAIDKVEKHIADAVKGGAKIVAGGKRHALGGTFFEPTVLSNVDARCAGRARGDLRSAGAGVPLQGRGRSDRAVQRLAVRPRLLFLCPRSRPRLARRRGAGIRHGRRQHRADHDRKSRRSAASRNPASAARARITAWKNMSRSNT